MEPDNVPSALEARLCDENERLREQANLFAALIEEYSAENAAQLESIQRLSQVCNEYEQRVAAAEYECEQRRADLQLAYNLGVLAAARIVELETALADTMELDGG